MKSIISKKVVGALVLAAAGLPLATQAATSTDVEIKATVTDNMEVSVAANSFSFTGKALTQDIVITTTHNTGTATKISLSGSEMQANGSFKLKKGTDTLPVTASFPGSTYQTVGAGSAFTTVIGANEVNKKTNLHLTLNPLGIENPGEYTGSLTITISKS